MANMLTLKVEEMLMEQQKRSRFQISFDSDLNTHAEIKVHAARRRLSMSRWIDIAIRDKLKKEKREETI